MEAAVTDDGRSRCVHRHAAYERRAELVGGRNVGGSHEAAALARGCLRAASTCKEAEEEEEEASEYCHQDTSSDNAGTRLGGDHGRAEGGGGA